MNIQRADEGSQTFSTTSKLGSAEWFDHIQARAGIRRRQHRVAPGLYALGQASPDSPVFVSANYTLSFDALRAALTGEDAYLLVLDTQGVNVWCAAGEGTFGTDELVKRIQAVHLDQVVRHRHLILPQLGAPGVAAHEVRERSGFQVEYGPVRARDLPRYLLTHQATPEMRRVNFPLADRLKVTWVDIAPAFLPTLIAAAAAYFTGGIWLAAAVVAAVLAGLLLFPVLLPWLPTRDFSSKGFILGAFVAIPFALIAASHHPEATWWLRSGKGLAMLLSLAPVTAMLALLYTGSTTFTSRTGVKREMALYVPMMAWSLGAGILLLIFTSLIPILGG